MSIKTKNWLTYVANLKNTLPTMKNNVSGVIRPVGTFLVSAILKL